MPTVRPARIVFVAAASVAATAFGQTTLNGSALALRSSGVASGATVTLNENGYLGTYVRLDAPGPLTLSASAGGTASNGVNPSLTFSVADYTRSFDVMSGSTNAYAYTSPVLPAGTYFVRAQLDNHETRLVNGAPVVASTALSVSSLTVGANATVLNASNDANARAAADTYISGFRKGNASVRLVGATPGSTVRVRLTNNDFKLGTYVSGGYSSTDSYLRANPPAGSDAAEFQSFIKGRFNSIVPSNAGKWDPNASVSSANVSTQKIGMLINDQMMAYAAANGMAARQHNLIWGNQQPTQIRTWVTDAASGSATASTSRDKLTAAIATRIQYYLKDANSVTGEARAKSFGQLDVLNEALQTGPYFKALGYDGIAKVYRDAQVAIAAAGADARLYTNEYNVLQYSPASVTPSATYGGGGVASGSDPYANWYRREIEAINNAGLAAGAPGDVVTGIGFQYYPLPAASSAIGPNVIQKAVQNLAVAGLPMTLTEFGGQTSMAASNVPGGQAVQVVDDTIRMMLGTPGVDSMLIWGWYDHDGLNNDMFGDGTSLVNKGWRNADGTYNLTAAGVRFEYLFGRGLDPTAPGANADGSNPDPWTTDVTLTVDDEGRVDFRGFYGDYALTVGGREYAFTLDRGTSTYVLALPEPAAAAAVATLASLVRRRRRRRAGRA